MASLHNGSFPEAPARGSEGALAPGVPPQCHGEKRVSSPSRQELYPGYLEFLAADPWSFPAYRHTNIWRPGNLYEMICCGVFLNEILFKIKSKSSNHSTSFHKYFIKKLTSESPPNSGYLCHISAFMGVSSERAATKNSLQEKQVPRFVITSAQVQLRPQASVTIRVQNHPQRKANLKNVLQGCFTVPVVSFLEAGWYSTNGKAGLQLLLGSPNCLGSTS